LQTLILMGVSGSGKSTVGLALSQRLGWRFIDGDDLHPPANVAKMRRGQPLNDDDRWPWLDAVREVIVESLSGPWPTVVACSALKQRYRHRLMHGLAGVELVYLQGSFEAIYQRLQARQEHFMPPALLSSQFEALEPPQDAFAVDATQPVGAIVAAICRRFGLGDPA
jgi:gluconokinase